MSKGRIIVVDDVEDMADTVARYLRDHGFEVDTRRSGTDALAAFAAAPADAVLTDLRMKGVDGMDVLDGVRRTHPHVPVVIMTAFGAIDTAVEAMRRGAYHYVTKPFQLDVVRLLLERACRDSALLRENERLRRVIRDRFSVERLIGDSLPMRELRALLDRVAGVNSPVLIFGETGVGKELVARAIHAEGPRADSPFVAVNCAALPEALLESELFGHAKGAFTGANQARRGLFAEADGGTLFLDEVGDMPLSVQAKLLRALQSGEVRAVGTEAPRQVDVRCVAATHHDLSDLVQTGGFREDLFFRLNVLRVRVPALRERPEDIPRLWKHFLAACRARIPNAALVGLTPEALSYLSAYAWPGNVRELENLVERIVVIATHPIADLAIAREALAPIERADPLSVLAQNPISLATLEDRYIAAVLAQVGGNKTRAAEILGIDSSTLYRRTRGKDQ